MGGRVKVPFRSRYATSRAILRQAFGFLRAEKRFMVFPIVSALVFILPSAAIGSLVNVPAVRHWLQSWAPFGGASWLSFGVLFVLPLMYPFMLVASISQGALAFASFERMEGRPVTRRQAWHRSLSQWRTFARFNLVALLVAGVFSLLGIVLNKLRLVPYLGTVVQSLGSLAWAVACFFVIPIIVVERQTSAIGAIRVSTDLARAQWGKSVAGIMTVGLAITVPMLAVVAVLAVAMFGTMAFMVLSPWHLGINTFLFLMFAYFGVTLLVVLAGSALAQSATAVYQTGLYRYARTGKIAGPFDRATLVDAWEPYRRA